MILELHVHDILSNYVRPSLHSREPVYVKSHGKAFKGISTFGSAGIVFSFVLLWAWWLSAEYPRRNLDSVTSAWPNLGPITRTIPFKKLIESKQQVQKSVTYLSDFTLFISSINPWPFPTDNNNLIALYESWNKPGKAEMWRAKMPQTEAKIEWHFTTKMAQSSLVKSVQPEYNYTTPYLPLF